MNELAQFHKNNKYLHWNQWGNLAFIFYCLSTVFMVFFSISAIQDWLFPWNQIPILLSCLLPLLFVFIWKLPSWRLSNGIRKEFIFVLILVFLGTLNIIYSEAQAITLKAMVLFLISGVGIFVVTSCILDTKFRQSVFLWLCFVCLLIFCIYGVFEYEKNVTVIQNPITLLSDNPLAAGSLLLLLMVSPLLLYVNSTQLFRFILVFSLLLGCFIIVFLIQKRGPLLGLTISFFLILIGILGKRSLLIIPIIVMLILFTVYSLQDKIPSGYRKGITSSDTIRLEHYLFAFHIFLKKPTFGVGMHAPFNPYLSDYKITISDPSLYRKITANKTLENILLLMIVEMGSLFAVTYFLLFFYLLSVLFNNHWKGTNQRLSITLFLAPLAGFIIHSMTYDSFSWPHLNWLFHSYLGMMTNFDKFNGEA